MEPFTDKSESTEISMPNDVKDFLIKQASESMGEKLGGGSFSEEDVTAEFFREEKGSGYGAINIVQEILGHSNYFCAKYTLNTPDNERNIEIITLNQMTDEILESHNLTEARQKRVSSTIMKSEGLVVRVVPDSTNEMKDHYIVIPNENSDLEERKIYATPTSAKQIK